MALQNRVTPKGEIIADPAHGLFMGNRGGRFHNPDKTLGARRWTGKGWIICRTAFKRRKRAVMMPNSYTELFFLDEATALAAGHRPCGECRRVALRAFVAAWDVSGRTPLKAIDHTLHGERVTRDREQITHFADADKLPDGAFVEIESAAWLVDGDSVFRWTPSEYAERNVRPDGEITVLTPRSTVKVLQAGYSPNIHPSRLNL